MLPTLIAGRRMFTAVARHDGALFDFICARRRESLNRLMILATRTGDSATYVLLGALGILIGGPIGDGMLGAAAAAGLASAAAWCVKRLIARPRPTRASSLRVALVAPPDAWSFPSGHTATAVATACALGAAFGPIALAFAIVWCVTIAISRVYVGAHYPLDVLMGAALGFAVHAALGDIARSIPGILASSAF